MGVISVLRIFSPPVEQCVSDRRSATHEKEDRVSVSWVGLFDERVMAKANRPEPDTTFGTRCSFAASPYPIRNTIVLRRDRAENAGNKP